MMIQRFDAASTEALLPFKSLVGELERAVTEYAAGEIASPERLVIPLAAGGVMLSMPASAEDIAIHKLVNVCPSNFSRNLATINGEVVAYDAVTGVSLFALDGPTVTGRRTAAVTLLGDQPASENTAEGYRDHRHRQAGVDACAGALILLSRCRPCRRRNFPTGRGAVLRQAFCLRVKPFADRDWSRIDVVVTLTTSKTPVYAEAAAQGRLIVG
jgi:1-piperideine-2-carboxylate/1-pyrroline-2-carboxylate reductase [NAD(P)H]